MSREGPLPVRPPAGSSESSVPSGRTPKVSVLFITFNHAATIRQALDSALNQVTDFPVEIIVGDDASTDGTGAIVAEFARRYPDRIRPLFHPRNLGFFGKFNLLSVYEVATAPYAIVLEGDDYWTDPRKLQRQADFLDRRPDCSACFHDSYVQDGPELDRRHLYLSPAVKRDLGVREIIGEMFPHTTSILFRRGVFGPFPPWFRDLELSDLSLCSLLARQGLFGFLPGEPMSVYRTAGGSWTSSTLVARTLRELKAFRVIGEQMGGEFEQPVKLQLNRRTFYLALGYDALGQRREARRAFREFFRGFSRYRSIPPRQVIRLAVKLYLPFLFAPAKRLRDQVVRLTDR